MWLEREQKCQVKCRDGFKRFVFSYFRLGEKFGEEVPPAGKQHVSQSVFIELIGVDAVC